MWRLIKSKKCDTAGEAPLTKNGLTTNDIKIKANILTEHFCSVLATEDINNLTTSPYRAMPEIQFNNIGVFSLLFKSKPQPTKSIWSGQHPLPSSSDGSRIDCSCTHPSRYQVTAHQPIPHDLDARSSPNRFQKRRP